MCSIITVGLQAIKTDYYSSSVRIDLTAGDHLKVGDRLRCDKQTQKYNGDSRPHSTTAQRATGTMTQQRQLYGFIQKIV